MMAEPRPMAVCPLCGAVETDPVRVLFFGEHDCIPDPENPDDRDEGEYRGDGR